MPKTKVMKKTPKAVTKWLADAGQVEDEDGLRSYMSCQKEFYDSLPIKHTDFVWWLCLKLTVNRRDARTIYKWATGKDA